MDRQRQALAVVKAHRIVSEAKTKKIKPQSLTATRKQVAARQRVTKASIERRRKPATRAAQTRRKGTNKLLVNELSKARKQGPTTKDLDATLKRALTAKCAAHPKTPVRNEADRKLAYRCAPMRFIIDLGKTRTTADATTYLSKRLGIKLSNDPAKWPSIEPLLRRPKRHSQFVLTIPMSRVRGTKQRFTIARAIRQRCGAESVQPVEPITLNGGTVDFATDPPPLDTEWPLKAMNVPEAWDRDPDGNGRRFGAGETIGHLDTGWFNHPEYDQNRIDLARAYNSVSDSISEVASEHSYEGGANETHGVATGALMVSRPADPGTTRITTMPGGAAEPANDGVQITGVAPEASVLPVRCLDSVFVMMDNVDLVRGAEYLIEPENNGPAKVGVISMSLGGVPHYSLEDVLNVGIRDKNVIAVAAAGQIYVAPLPVAAPAAYPEVIAIAASNPDDEPAYWTFSGPEIDVAAPGEGVWIADVRGEEQRDGSIDVNTFVGYGHGTSFSCALSAGVAAMWRAFYADDLDGGAYDGIPAAHVFRQHLRETARRPQGWDTAKFGAGIIDVDALLSTPLPDPDSVLPPPASVGFNPFIGIGDLFEGAVDVWDGLVDFGSQLGAELGALGRDAANAAFVVLSEMAAAGGAFLDAAAAIGLQVAQETAEAAAEFVEDAWTEVSRFADAAGDEIGRQAAAAAEELAEIWDEASEAAEEAAEAAAEAVEEAAEEVVEVVEDIVDAVGDAAEDAADAVVDVFTGIFG